MHRSVDLTENIQCSCFQQLAPNQKMFLAKKPAYEKHQKTQSNAHMPQHIQDLIAKSSIKKSLKRGQKAKFDVANAESPVRGSKIIEAQTNSPHAFREARSCEGGNYRDSFPASPPTIKINTINLSRPVESPRSPNLNIAYKTIQTKPTLLNLKQVPTIEPSVPFVFKPPRIKFNISYSPKQQPQATKVPHFSQKQAVAKADRKGFGIKKKFSLNENIKENRKLKRKLSQQKEFPAAQIKEQNSISMADSMEMETPQSPQENKKDHAISLKNHGRMSIFNSVPLEMKVHKSIIKEENHRNKVIINNRRINDFLNSMSEVEEIKSQPDSEDLSESDKESVVIGNLGNLVRQNSATFNMNIPQLSKGFQDNKSFESTVMSARLDRQTLSKLRDYVI